MKATVNVSKSFLVPAVLVCTMAFGKTPPDQVKWDSSVVLYQLSGDSDFTTTLVCRQGQLAAVVKFESWGVREVVREHPTIPIDTYLKLWCHLEEAGIWEVPPGEFWPYRELVEAQGGAAGINVRVERGEYGQDSLIDGTLVGVKIRVGEKTHGFLKYDPEHLMDQRYKRIQNAIWRFADLTTVLKELLKRSKGLPEFEDRAP